MRASANQLAFSFDDTAETALPYTLVCDDVLAWAQGYRGEKFHAICCDPPYHLTDPRGRLISGAPSEMAIRPKGGISPFSAARPSGFMGKKWDGGDIAFTPETWKALAQHLLPGAFIMAFASSRGFHRVMTAMEDAGLRLHPAIFGWLSGQSFPKATRIPDERFEGHRYGGQALKNSLEPIIIAQVPYAGKPVQSIVEHGSGSLNIDGGRIGTEMIHSNGEGYGAIPRHTKEHGARPYVNGLPHTPTPSDHEGRWPPNFALQHDPGCVAQGTRRVKGNRWGKDTPIIAQAGTEFWGNGSSRRLERQPYTDADGLEEVEAFACTDTCPVAALDRQAGARGAQNPRRQGAGIADRAVGPIGLNGKGGIHHFDRDTGAASRFFHVSSWSLEVAEQLAQAAPVHYCAKASRGEREKGLEGMMKLRDDLSDEERTYVMQELKAAGVVL